MNRITRSISTRQMMSFRRRFSGSRHDVSQPVGKVSGVALAAGSNLRNPQQTLYGSICVCKSFSSKGRQPISASNQVIGYREFPPAPVFSPNECVRFWRVGALEILGIPLEFLTQSERQRSEHDRLGKWPSIIEARKGFRTTSAPLHPFNIFVFNSRQCPGNILVLGSSIRIREDPFGIASIE